MNTVAKRYAKAIALRADARDFYENLRILASASTLAKFGTLVESTRIKEEKKLELIQSFFEQFSPNFKNSLKTLIENSGLSCVPYIVGELERQNAFKENVFLGVVYTNENLDEQSLKELENKLSAKFNAKIQLSVQMTQIDGVEVALEELGYESSFSIKTLQNKLNGFTLKTT